MEIKTRNASILSLALAIVLIVIGVVLLFGKKIRVYFTKTKSTPLPSVANISVMAPTAQAAPPAQIKHKFLDDQVINMQENQDYPLSPPVGANYAQFQIQGNSAFVRFGGSPATGGFLCETEELHTLENSEEISKAKFRTKTGAATLVINYFSA